MIDSVKELLDAAKATLKVLHRHSGSKAEQANRLRAAISDVEQKISEGK